MPPPDSIASYSSEELLKKYPRAQEKIEDSKIVQALLKMAASSGLKTISDIASLMPLQSTLTGFEPAEDFASSADEMRKNFGDQIKKQKAITREKGGESSAMLALLAEKYPEFINPGGPVTSAAYHGLRGMAEGGPEGAAISTGSNLAGERIEGAISSRLPLPKKIGGLPGNIIGNLIEEAIPRSSEFSSSEMSPVEAARQRMLKIAEAESRYAIEKERKRREKEKTTK